MATQFQGMDSVLEFLREQKLKEDAKYAKGGPKPAPSMSNVPRGDSPPSMSNVGRGPMMSTSHQFPGSASRPSMGKIPSAAGKGGGIFAETLGGAGSMLRGAGKLAGRAAGPIGAVMLANDFANVIREDGELARRADNKYSDRLPSLQELGYNDDGTPYEKKVTGSKRLPPNYDGGRQQQGDNASAKPAQTETYLPEELAALQANPGSGARTAPNDRADVNEQLALIDPSMQVPATEDVPDANAELVDPTEGMDTEAQSDIPPEMEYYLSQPDRKAPEVKEFDGSRETLAALGKNVGERPAQTDTTGKNKSFLRKTADFFRSGSANPELDKEMAQLKLHQERNRLTEREMLAAGFSKDDVLEARRLNNGNQMEAFRNPMSPQNAARADVSGKKEDNRDRSKQRREELGIEHEYRMKEIGASAKNQMISPEQQHRKFMMDLADKYPDVFKQYFDKEGIPYDPKALASITKGREGADKAAQIVAAFEAIQNARSGAGKGASKAGSNMKIDTSDLQNNKK